MLNLHAVCIHACMRACVCACVCVRVVKGKAMFRHTQRHRAGMHSRADVHFAGMHSSSQCSRSQCRHALKSRRTLCWHALNISMLKISVRACTQDLSAQNLSAGMHTKGDRHFAAKLTHYKWFQDKHAWLVNFTLLHRPQKSAKLGHEERFF